MSELHPWVAAAASGVLPDWAVARKKRRAHMARVAALLREWGEVRGDDPRDVQRWTAAGYLHDALRDAKPDELRAALARPLDQPDEVIHGPAAADRLRQGGVTDEPLLTAIAFTRWEAQTSMTSVQRCMWPTSSSLGARFSPSGGLGCAMKCRRASTRSPRPSWGSGSSFWSRNGVPCR